MAISLNTSLTSLRKGKHRARVFFGTWTPDIVFESTVLYGISDKAKFIPVDTGTGDITDCLPGYTVRVFSSSGAIKGATNIRAHGTPTAGILPIRENGDKDINYFTGDIVRVYNMPYLGDKLPEDTEAFAPDGLPYGTQGSAYRPNVVSGGHFIGYVDSGEAFATVPMWGGASANLDPDSTPSNVTHLWTLLTATLAFQSGSTSADTEPVIEADVGYGIALHTVTDDDNSTSWSQYVCFQVYDRDGSIPGFPLTSAALNGEELAGWSAEVEVIGAVPRSALPDGQMCAIWVDETIAGLHQSVGGMYVGREHIKFIGFLSRDEHNVSYRKHRTRFSLQSPLARYASLPGWSKVLTRTASPTDWTGIAGLTVKLAIYHLVKYYSFITELFDFAVKDDFLDQAFSQFFINKMTADAQIRELADGQDARLVNLRTGELLLHTHPAYYPIESRAVATKLLTATSADILDNGSFSRDHWKTLEQFELRAFKAGATNEQYFFSRYPGSAPGRGNQSHVVEKVIADDQIDANDRCGRRAAKLNGAFGEYQTLVGVYEQGVEWTPTLRGSYDGLDFHFGYINTTLDATSNGRGIDLSAHLFYLSRVSVTYNANGVSKVNPTLVTATNGGWGITHIPPVSVLPPSTPPDFITPPYFPPSNPSRLPPWNGIDQDPVKLVVLAANTNKAFIAAPWDSTSTTQAWTEVSTGLVGDGLWITADPYDYRRFFALTTNGLYRNDNLPGGGSWSQVASNTAMFGGGSYIGHNIIMSINRRGWIMVATGIQTVAVSFNYGVSWSLVAVDGGTPTPVTALSRFSVKIAASSNNSTASGVVYAAIGSGFSATDALYKTPDWGATWSLANADIAGVTTSTPVISVPHVRLNGDANINDSSQELYYVEGSGNQGAVRFSNTAGTSWTSKFTINAGGSVIRVDGCEAGYNLMPFTHDSNILIYSTQFGMAYSSDAGLTRDFASNVLSGASPSEWQCGVNGFGLHIGAMLGWNRGGTTGGLWWSLDAGATGVQCTLPSGVTLVANSQWLLDTFIAPG